ncbi:MAG: hypothetical protein EAX90_00305 [Candidatus Heimdallarchaeota archaeon]|nr:hypothetical protein [Candidatus Heimdallarchaeota archaeon]
MEQNEISYTDNDQEEIITLEEHEIEYMIDGQKQKKVSVVVETVIEEYNRKKLSLQLIALTMVLVIVIISPLKLLDSRTIIDLTAVGFITACILPSLIAIFGFLPGRRFSLLLSTFIFGGWVLVLSTFYLEIILLFVVLIIYFEVTRVVQLIEPILEGVISISESGAYYHATVAINRYTKFILRLAGILFSISLVFGITGRYIFDYLQSDIFFSIFMIISFILLIVISRKTLTPDIEKLLREQRRQELDDRLAKSHSKYS